jgi:hypothetical protein
MRRVFEIESSTSTPMIEPRKRNTPMYSPRTCR